KPLYVASRAIEKNVASNSLLENEKALELLHNSKYNVNRAAFQLASTVGAGQELRYLRKNFAEDERTRRGVRSDIAAKKLDGGKSSKHGNSSRSSKSGLSDKEVKKLWTTWNAKARNILNRSDDSSGRFCFNTLKTLLMEAKNLPQVTLVPGSSQESFVKSAITHQRKIQDRILLVNQWTANAHDILAGMNKHLYSLEELEKLLHDAKSLKGFLEDTNHVDDIIHDIKEWVSSYNTMIKKSMSGKCIRIEVFESLLKKSHNFPVKVPEVDDLRMRLSEAVAQGMRIRRIFPEFWEFQISNKQRLADGANLASIQSELDNAKRVADRSIQVSCFCRVNHACCD
ncbi:MAG: hypothetical protein HOD13_04880, partial [Rhodospirillaceae bacterium]|nr:hypothetical protein [Rhodospirillaceae bacterium]